MLSFLAGVARLGGIPHPLLTTLWRPLIPTGLGVTYLYLAAATIGATISSYLLYFYSSAAREERWTGAQARQLRAGSLFGMRLSP